MATASLNTQLINLNREPLSHRISLAVVTCAVWGLYVTLIPSDDALGYLHIACVPLAFLE